MCVCVCVCVCVCIHSIHALAEEDAQPVACSDEIKGDEDKGPALQGQFWLMHKDYHAVTTIRCKCILTKKKEERKMKKEKSCKSSVLVWHTIQELDFACNC